MTVSFPIYIQTVTPRLEAAFGRFLKELLEGSWDGLRHFGFHLNAGKKIRGCLLCRVAEALGGSLESAIPGAVAVEVLHCASLVHDDFIDQDRVRRSHPAVWTIEGARRAVLLGDVLFAAAIRRMNAAGAPEGAVVAEAIARVALGALREPLEPRPLIRRLEAARIDGLDYEPIIRLKTGALFAAACRLGALAAGRDDLQERIGRYGMRIGEAYQIADDLQEVQTMLAAERCSAVQLAPLVPALLYFTATPPSILAKWFNGLIGDPPDRPERCDFGLEILRKTIEPMRAEIERRIAASAEALAVFGSDRDFLQPLIEIPRDLIELFNAGSAKEAGRPSA